MSETTDCTPATLVKRLLDLVQAIREEAPRVRMLTEIESTLYGVQYNLHRMGPDGTPAILHLGWCLGRLATLGGQLARVRGGTRDDLRMVGVRCERSAYGLARLIAYPEAPGPKPAHPHLEAANAHLDALPKEAPDA